MLTRLIKTRLFFPLWSRTRLSSGVVVKIVPSDGVTPFNATAIAMMGRENKTGISYKWWRASKTSKTSKTIETSRTSKAS